MGSFATADKWPAKPSDILAVESDFIGDIVVEGVDDCVGVGPTEDSCCAKRGDCWGLDGL